MTRKRPPAVARSRGILAACGLLALGAAAPPALPDPSATPLQENMARSWYRNYDYGVEIDGALLPDAGLFQTAGKAYMLVFGPRLDSGYVWSLDPRVVRPVPKNGVTAKSEDEVLLAEAAFAGGTPIPWMQDGPTAIVFYAGQRRFKILRVPPIVGDTTPDEIFTHSPRYKKGAEEYQPDPQAVAYLKAVRDPVQVEVWFGSWCPHCRVVVPRFLKVMQASANPAIGVSYHGVPREFSAYGPAALKDVKGLPTFIFQRGGREIGRIRGEPAQGSLEAEVVRILKTSIAAAGR